MTITISRRHTTFAVNGQTVTVTDVSTNGSFHNDELIEEPISIDLSSGTTHHIRLGTRETFALALVPSSSLALVSANSGHASRVSSDSQIGTTFQHPDSL